MKDNEGQNALPPQDNESFLFFHFFFYPLSRPLNGHTNKRRIRSSLNTIGLATMLLASIPEHMHAKIQNEYEEKLQTK